MKTLPLTAAVVAALAAALSPALATSDPAPLARLALACIERPYPYKPGHVLTGRDDLREPRAVHPVFYGCFDWHSAVHGHWMLVRLLKTDPDHALAGASREALRRQFTAEAFRVEARYFERKDASSFERPYGWAWLLQLAAELHDWDDDDGRAWRRAIEPLEKTIVARYLDYLPKLSFPIREGVHPNTAFALGLGHDYARITGNSELQALIERRARDFYLSDTKCPVDYEPSGEDFFSPCLLQADLMRRVLDRTTFARYIAGLFPELSQGRLGGLTTPAVVSDKTDGKIVHLDGLNLVRAWTMEGVASALPEKDPRRGVLLRLAKAHADDGLTNVTSGSYEGEHWLASFAVYLTTKRGLDLETVIPQVSGSER